VSKPRATKSAVATAACTIAIKVIPNAPRTEITGRLGAEIKVKVAAPAVEGRANEALCDFLADQLQLPRNAVRLLRGETSRHKIIRIDGLTTNEMESRLGL
jgi:uncharacterized protein (TIGR00251 family)